MINIYITLGLILVLYVIIIGFINLFPKKTDLVEKLLKTFIIIALSWSIIGVIALIINLTTKINL